MSEIALYNLLKRIPDATDDEVEKAVADVAHSNDVATKADIKDMATKNYIDVAIAQLEARMTWKMVVLGIAIIGLIKYLPA
ncbi:MAG: hypothetical protein F4Y58_01175 [Gammaproteobacteria bacterium]|nr:hypothetical protein [Gammaproteobacteria bacterium]